ncbi:hypothetical protein BGK38_08400 [Corynebacterium diphtheriae]|nr:hypothetical protein BGK38_08400 [Corynebacterium diphtheriae]OWN43080.1 hypothetical protein AY507_08130 [Corynebacterium diphtheriae bv. mitis]OEH70151.1 hypothetical protein BHU47_03025 [Corynebacterium diphtheriae]OEH71130.1 hypothetical protein BHU48_04315 [Corynebacterium diphtheriae]OWN62067.1 hypothetical protein AY521_05810 [Corynebacterium diphtheriae bv. mitis]
MPWGGRHALGWWGVCGAGVGFSCPRIRDYVNPWSGPGCEHGDAGVFVITDSCSWIRAEGHENTPTTNQDHQTLARVRFRRVLVFETT